MKRFNAIQPSIFLTAYPLQGCGEVLEPFPAAIGWQAGYSLNGSPVYHGANRATDKIGQFRITNYPTHRHSANMETPADSNKFLVWGDRASNLNATYLQRKTLIK